MGDAFSVPFISFWFSPMNSTVKRLTMGGMGETRLLLEGDQKRDQAKSKAF